MTAYLITSTTAVGVMSSSSARVISVTAGRPSELAFVLTKHQAPLGVVVFDVRNAGTMGHTFKVCTAPSRADKTSGCSGKATSLLRPGQSAELTVAFVKTGTYEFFCTVPGHAAAGMRGVLRIGQRAPKPPSAPTPTTTAVPAPAATRGPKPPATEELIGDPAAGATLFFSNCGSCHALAAARTNGHVGPDLDYIAPSQELLVTQITNGRGEMPPFGSQLSSTQINDLAAYVYQATHSQAT
jgi:mono/diheme cytochrome c family protein